MSSGSQVVVVVVVIVEKNKQDATSNADNFWFLLPKCVFELLLLLIRKLDTWSVN